MRGWLMKRPGSFRDEANSVIKMHICRKKLKGVSFQGLIKHGFLYQSIEIFIKL